MSSGVTALVQRGLTQIRSVSAFPIHFFLVLAMAFIAGAQTSAPLLQPEEQSHSIRGTVINEVTGSPIPRALVFTGGMRFAMLTDGEGHFEFELPKPNTGNGVESQGYTFNSTSLVARKPGFLDERYGRNLVEADAAPGAEVTIPLMPEASITGRVIFAEADPALGATVQLFSRQVQNGIPRWLPAGSTRANSNGEFRFAELRPGLYRLGTNELPDTDPADRIVGQEFAYPPVYFPSVADFAEAGTIQLAAGESVHADIPLTRQPYYPVRIPVVNGEAFSIPMIVTVSLGGHFSPGYSLGYNSEEQRIEGSLPRGEYVVEAAMQGENAGAGSVHLSVASAPAQGPSLTLTPNSSIAIHVVEEFTSNDGMSSGVWNSNGRSITIHGPQLYLRVSAEPVDGLNRGGATLRPPTGRSDDPLILQNLAPGRYWLQLQSGRGYVASATMGGLDLLHEPFTVSPGSKTPIEITMRDDAAQIEGTIAGTGPTAVNAPHSAGLAPAYVYCVPSTDSPGQFLELVASFDGKLEYGSVAPGTYHVLAFKTPQPDLPYRDAEAMKAFDGKGQVVHFSAEQKTTVQLQVISTKE
ncbi:MAG TPA: hypothetical protein VFL34_17445 [Candidatus Sulfotelmatobacter sp.]|nr:hypothetical protein [Candidatus Sulfotelmatobacter sp.]